MDKLNMMLWIAWFYAFISSIALAMVGFGFPIILLGYVPWLVAISLVIQKGAYN